MLKSLGPIFFDIFNRKVYDSNSFIAIIKGF